MKAEISIATGIEQLFLHFCSIRTNKYRLNLSAKSGYYFVRIPNFPITRTIVRVHNIRSSLPFTHSSAFALDFHYSGPTSMRIKTG